MKGDTYPSEARSFRDAATGALTHQITSHASISHPSYFLQSSFLPGGEAMFFVSYRSGSAQLYEAAVPDGPIRQLTDGAPIHPFSPALSPEGDRIYFVRGGQIWWIDRTSLEENPVADFMGAQLGEVSLSADGEWLVAAYKAAGRNGLWVVRADAGDCFAIEFPRTVIHPQFHPLEPEWIEFAADPAPRMFRVRRDGSGLECLYEHDNDEFVVHETFLGSTGDIVFVVWPQALRRLDWATREITTITGYNAWHIAPDRAGRRVLCDTNHPDEGLQIIDANTGARQQVCLSEASSQGSQWRRSCYALAEDFAAARSAAKSGSTLSWMEAATDTVYGPQWTHPHPSWSREEKRITYASDRTGSTQVYVVDLPAGAL